MSPVDPYDLPPLSEVAEPTPLHFQVYGRPQPAGSKKGFAVRKGGELTGRVAVTDDNPRSRDWKQAVAAAGEMARADCYGPDDDGELLEGPLTLCVVFTFTRPKSHFGTGRNARIVKASAPDEMTVRPDATKLLRGLEDALTGVLWRDDAQIVTQSVRKRYGPWDRAEVTVWPI